MTNRTEIPQTPPGHARQGNLWGNTWAECQTTQGTKKWRDFNGLQRAGDRARTGEYQLGKLVLYQLSYAHRVSR